MKLARLLLVPFALVVVILVRLLYPWKLIRFGPIWASRIGHLIGNTECYLCEKDSGIHKAFDIFYPEGEPCNKVIYQKYKKLLHIWPAWFCSVVMKVGNLFRGWEKHTVSDAQFGRDIYNLWKNPHISFTEKEEEEGKKLLRNLGIPEGSKWVCLIVRDGAYLKDLTYHTYRNSDIDTYAYAAILLAGRGYYVIRMGSVVEKPFKTGLRYKVIDYATNGKRTEFGDLYLGAKCEFCISTGTGFDEIPHVFGRPIVYVNLVPVEYIPTFTKGYAIWKHHFRNGKEMTFDEIIESGSGQFMSSVEFENAGITLKNNSPEEIGKVTLELLENSNDSQKDFWDNFPRSISPYNKKPLHGKILIKVGRTFLARMKGDINGNPEKENQSIS